jgi:hypothetical protein
MLELTDAPHDDHQHFLNEIVAIGVQHSRPRQPVAQERTVHLEQLFPVALVRVAGKSAEPGEGGLHGSLAMVTVLGVRYSRAFSGSCALEIGYGPERL